MSKQDKLMYKPLNIIIIALSIISLLISFSLLGRSSGTAFDTVLRIVNFLTILAGLIYIVYGYKKNVAIYYKVFMFLFSISTLAYVVFDLINTKVGSPYISNISGILRTVICVISFILTFAKDLGKSTSMSLAYAMLGVGIVNTARLIIMYGNLVMVAALNNFILILIGFLFVIEKYIDKESRGTK